MEHNESGENSRILALDSLIKQENFAKLTEMLVEMPTAQAVEFLTEQENIDDTIRYLNLLDYENAGRIVTELEIELSLELFRKLGNAKFARIFEYISSDVRADLYQELNTDEQTDFIPYLNKKTREDVISLSSYPPETAGGIMTTDFATIMLNMTAREAIQKLKDDAPSKKMIYYLYVVNENMKLQGILSLKDLIYAEPTDLIKDMINEFFVWAMVGEDQESVVAKIEKYDLVAIPVLNNYQQLVGIVHHDDAIDVIRAEQTEDMEKFMAILPSEDSMSYMDSSTVHHFKKRVIWLVGLAAVGLISGIIINHYQHVLEHLIILALYIPMMTATGGNSGSQAATVVIRALALREIQATDWLKIIFKEARISFLLSLAVATLTFFKIAFLTSDIHLPPGITFPYVALVISIAIALQVIASALVGAGLPLVVKRFGGDPAVAASPAITTLVDITGLLIYFTVVKLSIPL